MTKSFSGATTGAPEFVVPTIEDGLYSATIREITDAEGTWDGKTYDQYYVDWDLDAADEKTDESPVQLRQFVRVPDGLFANRPVLNENSHLYLLMEGLGCDMDGGYDINPDEWLGKEARVLVENKKITEGPNAGKSRPRITAVKPKSSKAASKRGDNDF